MTRLLLLMATLFLTLLHAGCAHTPHAQSDTPAAVQGLVATLEDEVIQLADDRIRWKTYWKLCWDEYPGASAYELQILTSEGSSPKFRRQTDRCVRLEVAAGENERSKGLLNRDMLIALVSSTVGYRVRAELGEGRFSEWSRGIAVGEGLQKNP